jgi:hypothetical protein
MCRFNFSIFYPIKYDGGYYLSGKIQLPPQATLNFSFLAFSEKGRF